MLSRPQARRRARGLLALLAAVLAMVGLFTMPAAAQQGAEPDAKIEQAVVDALSAKDNADFLILFGQQADLSAASAIKDWNARGTAVVDALRRTADASQAAVRAELDANKISYQSFFIANAIMVRDGTTALAESLAKRAEVSGILAPRDYAIPEPTPGRAEAEINAIEWGLAAINADDVWNTFGVRGEGIIVGSIDTGVDFNHPALVGKYRGNTGGGTFDHNYNWFDPANLCGNPSTAPCDRNGHGTHTMGTMVGDDGGANQIGVAPNARWIAAAGCCPSTAALLSAGEWMLAPKDLTGANPRADLRPHVVNNSWGSTVGTLPTDPFYKATVAAWRASGIFPAFANGNSGASGCESSGSPGDYVESYAAGAFDINGAIASFSSRGPGETGTGTIKPNLSAPGVNVRSSLPGGGYGAANGTSMASPHMVGTVALMWASAPSLIGDIATTESLLDDTAVDVSNLTCGGTDDDNNVWGEGKLDAFAAVDRSPRGPVGVLTGVITNAGNGSPIAGASVAISGPSNRNVTTGTDGRYTATLPVGDYTVRASAFGFGSATGSGTVAEGQTTTVDLALTQAAQRTVSGHVRDAGGAGVAGATVQILGTPIPAVTTGADGAYSIPGVPDGSYQVKAAAGACFDELTQPLVVDSDETLVFGLPYRKDAFGNFCTPEGPSYVEADTPVALSGDDAATSITLPFNFFHYGKNYRNAFVSTNGHINFLASSTSFSNVAIPATGAPNAAIYPFWDDLDIDADSRVLTKTLGAAPNREFVIEWRNAEIFNTPGRLDFEAVLAENGEVSFRYRNIDPASTRERGDSATIGIENETGTVARQYSFNTAGLVDDRSIRFKLPPNGAVAGRVTDFNDGLGVEGATVRALRGTTEITRVSTEADGGYRFRALVGDYTVEVTKQLYVTDSGAVAVGDATSTTRDVALHTPQATLQGGPLSFLAEPGQLRTAQLTLGSTSELELTYQISVDASWVWTVPGAGAIKPGNTQKLTVRVDPDGMPAGVHNATISLTTNAGRTPVIRVPVTVVVPAYRKGIDVGATGAFTDAAGDAWVADQRWDAGGFGYLGTGWTNTSKREIAGTTDDALFQTQRESTSGYRFDALPAGTYQVQLGFAELRPGLAPGRRVFDVSINGQLVLPGYDATARVGNLTADVQEFWVTVSEGGAIQIDLGARRGQLPPAINLVRVTHRPDR